MGSRLLFDTSVSSDHCDINRMGIDDLKGGV